jgi:kynureninase
MNSLTANLHFLMVPFYTPTPQKYKILMEAKSFPSDYFAFESQVKFHGFDPQDAIIQVEPKKGAFTLDTSDIIDALEQHGDQIALVLFSGVQFYTGQFFDIAAITSAAHQIGCIVGWDLAHAVGNVELKLHEWNVDFAAWCSYKYLNSGPGGIGGAFVHEKHAKTSRPRFAGWWGSTDEGKFDMELDFKCIPGAQGYRLSNPSVLTTIALKASLDIFDKTSMQQLCAKSKDLTGYLEFLIHEKISKDNVSIITPSDPERRGCQLSLLFIGEGVMMKVFQHLSDVGIVCDERKPNVIRVAPTPLYNTFTDVWIFVNELNKALQ